MKLLALDTSTEQLSLAIAVDTALFTYEEIVGNASSAHVLPQIQVLLDQANLNLSDLDGIAYGAGPGAFTGVRIATGVTQGLALAHNLPVVGIPTTLALAESSAADYVVVCMDARMGEVYHAVYEKTNQGWHTTMPPGVYKPEAVPVISENRWVGVGTGWKVHAEALHAVYQDQIVKTLPDQLPSAQAVLALARPVFVAGEGKPAGEALPLYVRNRVALTTQQRAAGERL